MQPILAAGVFGKACQADDTCGTNGRCDPVDAVCICKPLFTACADGCVDLAGDAAHCGGCQVACRPALVCDHGNCAASVTELPPVRVAVGEACTAGENLTAGSSCVAGVTTCNAGKTACNQGCADFKTDWTSCGSCGAVCPGDCVNGVCSWRTQGARGAVAQRPGSVTPGSTPSATARPRSTS
ncbi:MAG TPA: hypothetical protein VGM56_09385 [Byssovorax sp.]